VDEFGRLRRVAIDGAPRRSSSTIGLGNSAIVGRAREAANAIREILRRERRRKVACGGLKLGFAFPDGLQLSDLLVESHSSEQVIDSPVDRLRGVLVQGRGTGRRLSDGR